jgi:hypothetical protein
MKDPHGKGAGSTESSGANSNRKVSIRKRWEEVRYGRVGRVFGYLGTFTAVLVVVTLILWALERYSH